MTAPLLTCAGPHCPHTFPITSWWVQVDIPDRGFMAFCDLKCLGRWCQAHGPTGWRSLGTRWADRPADADKGE